jgi:hypothetical protein
MIRDDFLQLKMEGQRILTEVFSERGRGTHTYTLSRGD